MRVKTITPEQENELAHAGLLFGKKTAADKQATEGTRYVEFRKAISNAMVDIRSLSAQASSLANIANSIENQLKSAETDRSSYTVPDMSKLTAGVTSIQQRLTSFKSDIATANKNKS